MSQNTDTKLLKQVLNIQFERNLLFFKQQFPHLYQRFKGYQPKDFGLEIDPNGYLNIAGNGTWVYEKDPKETCIQQAKAFLRSPIKSVYRISPMGKNDKMRRHPMGFLHPLYLNKMAELARDYVVSGKEQKLQYETLGYYPFFSVVGTGLGYHLEELTKEDIGHLYIYEPHNDMFYASMFTTDWEWIVEQFTKTNKGITLLVGVPFESYLEGFQKLFHKLGIFKSGCLPIYQHYSSEMSDEVIRNFFKNTVALYGGFGFFEDEMLSVRNTRANFKKKVQILPEALPQHSSGQPRVFICGSGPSIDYAIDFIKENRDSAIVISCGSALKVLHKADIIPDFHIEVERTRGIIEFLGSINDPEYFSKITLVAMQNVMNEVVQKFGDAYIYLKPNDGGTDLVRVTKPNHGLAHLFASNPTVTNGAVAFSNYLRASEMYLFGVDLGYKDPKKHHSKDSAYFNELKDKVNHDKFNSKRQVEGNFGDKVYVHHVFDWARVSMEYAFRRQNFDCKIFNCSDGALIQGAQPTRMEEINLTGHSFDKMAFLSGIKAQLLQEPIKFKAINRELQIRAKKVSDIISYITDPKFLDFGDLTSKDIIEVMNRNYLHLMSHDGSKDIFAMRMISGSLTYMQITIVGFLFTLRTEKERTEYGKKALQIMYDYLDEMRFMFENEFADIEDA